jgi:SAM-dependent methyltransferase
MPAPPIPVTRAVWRRRCLRALARNGIEAVGVDASPTMLARARRVAPGATVLEAESSRLPFAAEFDAATITLALHEMAPQARRETWQAMRRAVRPGGLLVALDYDPPGSGWLSRRVARSIERDERSFQRFDPAHYDNFREFMAGGGLGAWLAAQGDAPARSASHLWDNLLVAAVRPASTPHRRGAGMARGDGGLQR